MDILKNVTIFCLSMEALKYSTGSLQQMDYAAYELNALMIRIAININTTENN